MHYCSNATPPVFSQNLVRLDLLSLFALYNSTQWYESRTHGDNKYYYNQLPLSSNLPMYKLSEICGI